MVDWLNFRLGVIICLIHALEKRYYQNKTQLCHNFGSVYYNYIGRNMDHLANGIAVLRQGGKNRDVGW